MEGQVKPIYEDWLIGDIKSFDVDNSKIKSLGLEFRTDFSHLLAETIEEMKKYLDNTLL